MCIIIDANVAHKFTEPPHADFAPVVSWLLSSKKKQRLPRLAIGGKLRKELRQAGKAIRGFLLSLNRAGRLYDVDDDRVDAETRAVVELLEEAEIAKADDPHILALARVSGSRLLASEDSRSGLHALFKDRRFLKPPGKVYQNASHERLLRKAPECKDAE
jgi:hypothetical protein